MTLETIFITQIASVVVLLLLSSILYRLLVSAKNATIETLKQQIELNEQKISEFESQEPDILLQRLIRRIEALENELRKLQISAEKSIKDTEKYFKQNIEKRLEETKKEILLLKKEAEIQSKAALKFRTAT